MATVARGIGWAAESRPPGRRHRGGLAARDTNPRGPQPGGSSFLRGLRPPFRWKSHDFQRPYRDRARALPERGPVTVRRFLHARPLWTGRAKPAPRRAADEPALPARPLRTLLKEVPKSSLAALGRRPSPVSIRWRKVVRPFVRQGRRQASRPVIHFRREAKIVSRSSSTMPPSRRLTVARRPREMKSQASASGSRSGRMPPASCARRITAAT
jgi:hypothetical protein